MTIDQFFCVLLQDGVDGRPIGLVTKNGGARTDRESQALVALGMVLEKQTPTTLRALRDRLGRVEQEVITTPRGCVAISDQTVSIETPDVRCTLTTGRCAELVDGWRVALECALAGALKRSTPLASTWRTCPKPRESPPSERETVEILLEHRPVPGYLLADGDVTSIRLLAIDDVVRNPGTRGDERTAILRELVDGAMSTGPSTPARMAELQSLAILGLLPDELYSPFERTGYVDDRDWALIGRLRRLAAPIDVSVPRWVLEVSQDGLPVSAPPAFDALRDGVGRSVIEHLQTVADALTTDGWSAVDVNGLRTFDPDAHHVRTRLVFNRDRRPYLPPWLREVAGETDLD